MSLVSYINEDTCITDLLLSREYTNRKTIDEKCRFVSVYSFRWKSCAKTVHFEALRVRPSIAVLFAKNNRKSHEITIGLDISYVMCFFCFAKAQKHKKNE